MKKIVLGLLAFIFITIHTQAQTFELNFKPTLAKVYKCHLKTNIVISRTQGDIEVTIPMNVENYFNATIKSIEANGNVSIEYKLTRVVADTYDPSTASTVKIDTDKNSEIDTPAEQALKQRFAAQLNKLLKASYSIKGVLVSKDEGLDDAISRCLVMELPTEKVAVGSTWQTSENDVKNSIDSKTKNTIKANNAGILDISSSATLSVEEDKAHEGQVKMEKVTGMVKAFNVKDMQMDMGFMKMKLSMQFAVY